MIKIANFLKIANATWHQQLKKCSNLVAMTNAKLTADQRFVVVDVNKKTGKDLNESEKQLKYPSMWLRDNCQCSECFHASSKSRTIDWTTFDLNSAKPKSIAVDKQLEITWNDDHVSRYDFNWLFERNFTAANRQRYLTNEYRPPMDLWSKDQFVLEQFEFADVLESDEALRGYLDTLARRGVALLKNAASTEDQARKLANRVGFIRKTHYGEEYLVRAVPNATNYAYTSNPLQLHTDLPYYEYNPGLTMLHCIQQSKSAGAFNLLVDGFYVAERLKRESPSMFECLTQTMINWSDYVDGDDDKFQKIYRMPSICLDREGNFQRINHSVAQRDSYLLIDVDKVDEWYAANKAFINMLYSEAVYFKMEPGDILAFSNIRLLHGRTGYVDKEGNVRHLVGAYIDWDEIYSRLRIVSSK